MPGTAEQRRAPTSFPPENPFPDIIRKDFKGKEYRYVFGNRQNPDLKVVDPEDIKRYKRYHSANWSRRDGPMYERRPRRTQEEHDDWKQRLIAKKRELAAIPRKKMPKTIPWPWQEMLDEHNAKFDGRVFPKGTPYAHTDESIEKAKSNKRKTCGPISTEEELFQERPMKGTKNWISKCSALNKIRLRALDDEDDDDETSPADYFANQPASGNGTNVIDPNIARDVFRLRERYNPIAENAAENGFGGIYDAINGTPVDRAFRIPEDLRANTFGRRPFMRLKQDENVEQIETEASPVRRSSKSELPRRNGMQALSIRPFTLQPSAKGKLPLRDGLQMPLMRRSRKSKPQRSRFHPAIAPSLNVDVSQYEGEESGYFADESHLEVLDSDPGLQIALAESIKTPSRTRIAPSNIPAIEQEPHLEHDTELNLHGIITNFRDTWPIWTDQAEREANVAYAMATAGRVIEEIDPILAGLEALLAAANEDADGNQIDVDSAMNTVRQRRFNEEKARDEAARGE